MNTLDQKRQDKFFPYHDKLCAMWENDESNCSCGLFKRIKDYGVAVVDALIDDFKEHEIRTDGGGDYISGDTELMRHELIAKLYDFKSTLTNQEGDK